MGAECTYRPTGPGLAATVLRIGSGVHLGELLEQALLAERLVQQDNPLLESPGSPRGCPGCNRT